MAHPNEYSNSPSYANSSSSHPPPQHHLPRSAIGVFLSLAAAAYSEENK